MKNKPFNISDDIKIQAIKNVAEDFSRFFGPTKNFTDTEYLEKYRDILSFRRLHTGTSFEKSFYPRLQEMIQEEVEYILKNRH
ncbi:MAG: hypothetical protein PHN60_00445 [Candidatus Gracilibacteria bacterium]|nr:hypothetical protein [Candidatus Gracilibacteria bacterium]